MEKFNIVAIFIALVALSNAGPITRVPAAERARTAINKIDWISIATISTQEDTKDFPIVNVKSTADAGTGVPYFFFTDLDFSVIDINVNPKVSVLATEAAINCSANNLDPQDPRCLRLILTGTVVKVTDKAEHEDARKALLEKHPVMEEWASVHQFYISKLHIEHIALLDHFGGADIIDPVEYLAVELEN